MNEMIINQVFGQFVGVVNVSKRRFGDYLTLSNVWNCVNAFSLIFRIMFLLKRNNEMNEFTINRSFKFF